MEAYVSDKVVREAMFFGSDLVVSPGGSAVFEDLPSTCQTVAEVLTTRNRCIVFLALSAAVALDSDYMLQGRKLILKHYKDRTTSADLRIDENFT